MSISFFLKDAALPCFLHSLSLTSPHMLQKNLFSVFPPQVSQTLNIVSFSHDSHSYNGNSAVIFPASKALWKHLSLPPSSPIGNNVWGLPVSCLIFAFSGLPILAPINVPALSRTGNADIVLTKSKTSPCSLSPILLISPWISLPPSTFREPRREYASSFAMTICSLPTAACGIPSSSITLFGGSS